MTTSYTPDATVTLDTAEHGLLVVHLAGGGEQFPWAIHKGRVIIGPPDGTLTSDGASMDNLDWNSDPYWVIEALDVNGDPVDLNPEEYAKAIQMALAKTATRYTRVPEA